jgi:hypothetical protein
VYRRADLWRTFVLVVALLLTAGSTGALACELRSPDTNTGDGGLSHVKFALISTSSVAVAPPSTGQFRGVRRT